jgi:hypothetical protein
MWIKQSSVKSGETCQTNRGVQHPDGDHENRQPISIGRFSGPALAKDWMPAAPNPDFAGLVIGAKRSFSRLLPIRAR